jgi:hypothetical protein
MALCPKQNGILEKHQKWKSGLSSLNGIDSYVLAA